MIRRHHVWLNLLVFLLPLGLLGFFTLRLFSRIWRYFNTDARLASLVSTEATRILKRPVVVHDVKFQTSPWSLLPNRVELSGVTVAAGPSSNGLYLGQFDRIAIGYDLGQLLFGKDRNTPLVSDVKIVRPIVSLSRDANGRWDFAQLIRPGGGNGRPFTDKIVVVSGTIFYSDRAFPHPIGMTPQAFSTRFSGLTGRVLIRPDKSFSYDFAGQGDRVLMDRFLSSGIINLNPVHFDVRFRADRLNAPAIAKRLLSPRIGNVLTGSVDADLSLLYSAPFVRNKNRFDLSAVGANGVVHLGNVSFATPKLSSTMTGVNGDLILTRDAAMGHIVAGFAGSSFDVRGRASGLSSLYEPHPATRSDVLVSLQGTVKQADYGRIAHAIDLAHLTRNLSDQTRHNLAKAGAKGSLAFQIEGSLRDPTATVDAQIDTVHYNRFQASRVRLRALYAHHVIDADARGDFAQGEAVVRGHVSADPIGPFEIEGHGRGLRLALLKYPAVHPIDGLAQFDVTLRGRRGRTPFISAQAEASNLSYRGQTISQAYARAATLGRKLVIKTLQAEDDKGFVLGGGTVDLSTGRLALDLEADELDLGAVAQAINLSRNGPGVARGPLYNEIVQPQGAQPTPLFDLKQLTGVGYVLAHITGKIKDPQIQGQADAFALQAGRAGIDHASVKFHASRRDLTMTEGSADRYPGSLSFHGTLTNPLGGDPGIQLVAQAKDFDLTDLLDLTGVVPATEEPGTNQLIVTGRINSDPLQIGGALKSIHLIKPAVVRLDQASVNGVSIEAAEAALDLNHGGLEVVQASAQTVGGALTASGTIGPGGHLDLSVSGHGLSVTGLSAAIPGSHETSVAGDLGFDSRITGKTDNIQITAQATVDDLTYKDFKIGRAAGSASYADGRVLVDHATLQPPSGQPADAGLVDVRGLSYDRSGKDIQGVVTVSKLPIERMTELFSRLPYADTENGVRIEEELNRLASPIRGEIGAIATLSGTTDEPVADLTMHADDIVVDSEQVSSITGSALVTREQVRIPSPNEPKQVLRLESPDVILIGNRLNVVYGGSIDADVSAYNVNLSLPQNLPHLISEPPSYAIGGMATLFVTATGTTKSPILDVSGGIKNLTYAGQTIDSLQMTDISVAEPRIQSDIITITKTYKRPDGTEDKFQAQAHGWIGFKWQSPFIAKDAPLNVAALLPPQDLQALAAVAPNAGLDTDGKLSASVEIGNTLNRFEVTGSVKLNATYFRLAGAKTGLQNIDGEIKFDRNSVTIGDGFKANSYVYVNGVPEARRKGSPIVLSGSLAINDAADAPSANGISLKEDTIYIDENPLPELNSGRFSGTGSIDLTVSGTMQEPTLGGSITVKDAILAPPSGLGSKSGGGLAIPINPAFDLALHLDRNVRVQNSQLTARVDGDVTLKGRLFEQSAATAAKLNVRDETEAKTRQLGIRLFGNLAIREGRLKLPTARFNIVPPGSITLNYPTFDPSAPGQQTLGVNVDVKAQSYIDLTSPSSYSGRKRYQVTVTAKGPLTGLTQDPVTGRPRLALNFQTDPPDFAGDQADLQQRLAGALGGNAIGQIGRSPGQVITEQLTNVFTSSVLPNLFDRSAKALGFDDLSINYDPVQRLSLVVSRHILGPLYVTYIRSLGQTRELYDIKASLRLSDRYQLSYEEDQDNTSTVLLEGVLHF